MGLCTLTRMDAPTGGKLDGDDGVRRVNGGKIPHA